MSLHKFKNPRINQQYKKPACHTNHCFERMACCNNYRCCVCHCCLPSFPVYDKVRDTCAQNATNARPTLSTKPAASTKRDTARVSKTTIIRSTPKSTTKITTATHRTQGTTTQDALIKRDLGTAVYRMKSNTRFGTIQPTTVKSLHTTKRYQKEGSKNSLGQRPTRDDKTSTVAGVVVALALLAIVAIIVVVVVCSKKKKRRRKMADPPETRHRADENGIVTIPLTIQTAADDSYRDTEEATTSDTTIDSPMNPSEENTSSKSTNGLSSNHLMANYPIKTQKNVHRKPRKSRNGKSKNQSEQTLLCKVQNGSADARCDSISNGGSELINNKVIQNGHEPGYVTKHQHPPQARQDEIEAKEVPMHENEDISSKNIPTVNVHMHSDGVRMDSQVTV